MAGMFEYNLIHDLMINIEWSYSWNIELNKEQTVEGLED